MLMIYISHPHASIAIMPKTQITFALPMIKVIRKMLKQTAKMPVKIWPVLSFPVLSKRRRNGKKIRIR